MSLSVYLYDGTHEVKCDFCGHNNVERRCVFSANITHNLTNMAAEADLYQPLWHPKPGTTAREVGERLRAGINRMTTDPARFWPFEPSNKWGSYSSFLQWCEEYLAACDAYPNAIVEVSR